jgi:hypothetical protein
MNPSLISLLVDARQQDLERQAHGSPSGRPRRHRVARPIGRALIRAGRRLAGPES